MTNANPQTDSHKSVHDRDLLGRFLRDNDTDAFAEIVHRHGRMVNSVCRRVLPHAADAEDAFQATFLALARRPRTLRAEGCLSSWLYTVAWRTSWRTARQRQRHATDTLSTEPSLDTSTELDRIACAQDCVVLDEELHELPQRYRDVLVLSYFSGRSNRQIADQLAVSKGTVEGRLRRARNLLRVRLVRRGITMSALAIAASQCTAATAAVSPAVMTSTIQLSSEVSSGSATAGAHLTPFLSSDMTIMNTSAILSTLFAAIAAVGLAGVGMQQGEQLAPLDPTFAASDSRRPEISVQPGSSSGRSAAENPVVPDGSLPAGDLPVTAKRHATEENATSVAARSTSPAANDADTSMTTENSRNDNITPFPAHPQQASAQEQWMHTLLTKQVPEHDWPSRISISDALDVLARHFSQNVTDAHGRNQSLTFRPEYRALTEAGVQLQDVQLEDLDLDHTCLESALQLMFAQTTEPQLDFLIRDDSFLITTREAAAEFYEVRIYDVSLVSTLFPPLPDQQTARVIERHISPHAEFGSGNGFFSVPDKRKKDGGENERLYQRLYDRLFEDLNRHPHVEDESQRAPLPPNILSLSLIVERTAEGARWIEIDGEGGMMTIIGDLLVINQTQAVHRRITALLTELHQRAAWHQDRFSEQS